jgi:putative transposase
MRPGPGSTYFFTVNLAEHNRTLLIKHVDWFKHVLRGERKTHPFRVDALVVLSDHLHVSWHYPG